MDLMNLMDLNVYREKVSLDGTITFWKVVYRKNINYCIEPILNNNTIQQVKSKPKITKYKINFNRYQNFMIDHTYIPNELIL